VGQEITALGISVKKLLVLFGWDGEAELVNDFETPARID
jgi:hypothetical protein